MSNRSFLDRYRWYLFLGAFAINLMFVILKNAVPALNEVYMVVNVLSGVLLVAGIIGFVKHRTERDYGPSSDDAPPSRSDRQ